MNEVHILVFHFVTVRRKLLYDKEEVNVSNYQKRQPDYKAKINKRVQSPRLFAQQYFVFFDTVVISLVYYLFFLLLFRNILITFYDKYAYSCPAALSFIFFIREAWT